MVFDVLLFFEILSRMLKDYLETTFSHVVLVSHSYNICGSNNAYDSDFIFAHIFIVHIDVLYCIIVCTKYSFYNIIKWFPNHYRYDISNYETNQR